MTQRVVTERDFRLPEFRDANVEDYEFRDDGKVVRKDRWERGLRDVASKLGWARRPYEIEEVVAAVGQLVTEQESWESPEHFLPSHQQRAALRLMDGSVLRGTVYDDKAMHWSWCGVQFSVDQVEGWRSELGE